MGIAGGEGCPLDFHDQRCSESPKKMSSRILNTNVKHQGWSKDLHAAPQKKTGSYSIKIGIFHFGGENNKYLKTPPRINLYLKSKTWKSSHPTSCQLPQLVLASHLLPLLFLPKKTWAKSTQGAALISPLKGAKRYSEIRVCEDFLV